MVGAALMLMTVTENQGPTTSTATREHLEKRAGMFIVTTTHGAAIENGSEYLASVMDDHRVHTIVRLIDCR